MTVNGGDGMMDPDTVQKKKKKKNLNIIITVPVLSKMNISVNDILKKTQLHQSR